MRKWFSVKVFAGRKFLRRNSQGSSPRRSASSSMEVSIK
jgi:hypothetical protein